MGTPGRRTDPSVAEQLLEEGYRFDFFQAVRLLERVYPNRRAVGREGPPGQETVRFRAHLSLSFPPSPIYSIQQGSGDQLPREMTVNFMGLTGPMGVLPRHYTELLMERVRAKDTTLLDFLDLFNHRLISLFYRVWEKHHVAAQYDHAGGGRLGEDKTARYLFSLIGLGTKGLRHRVLEDDRAVLCYGGLIGQRPSSALALQQWLADYFRMPVQVEQMVGAWLPLGEEDLSRLGSSERNNRLGQTAVAGTTVWDQQAGFRVNLGPLSFEKFSGILPTGPEYGTLVKMCRYFAGLTLDFEVRPILQRTEVPECRLGGPTQFTPHLGWNTWLKTETFASDARDVIFKGRLDEPVAGTA